MWLISIEQVRGVNAQVLWTATILCSTRCARAWRFNVHLSTINHWNSHWRPIGNSFLCLQFYVTDHRKISGARSHSTKRLQLRSVPYGVDFDKQAFKLVWNNAITRGRNWSTLPIFGDSVNQPSCRIVLCFEVLSYEGSSESNCFHSWG